MRRPSVVAIEGLAIEKLLLVQVPIAVCLRAKAPRKDMVIHLTSSSNQLFSWKDRNLNARLIYKRFERDASSFGKDTACCCR